MYEFQHYNADLPQIITSFKGNQKLILGGYRYNIHHVKEGVKTWRCVCAKKLTGSRSWCKGRAETWDNDTKGIPKGEHNHPTEHELAELEYFKSQLILAAITDPSADLNTMIDEASQVLSDGINFGNRESMKKSLIVARKSVENGEFNLGQHQRISVGRSSGSTSSRRTTARKATSTTVSPPTVTIPATVTTSATTATMTRSTVRSALQQQNSSPSKRGSSTTAPRCTAPTSCSFTSSLNSSAGSSGLGTSFASSGMDDSGINWMDLSGGSLNGSGDVFGAQSSSSTNDQQQLLAAALIAAAMLGAPATSTSGDLIGVQPMVPPIPKSTTSPSKRARNVSMPHASSSACQVTERRAAPAPAASVWNARKKTARVNRILNKLSTKAAEKSVSPSPSSSVHSEEHNTKPEPTTVELLTVATQTEPVTVTVDDGDVTVSTTHKEEENGQKAKEKRKVICCCFCENDEEVDKWEFPAGCKKRIKLEQTHDATASLTHHPSDERNGIKEEETEDMFDLERELKLEIADDDEEEEEQ